MRGSYPPAGHEPYQNEVIWAGPEYSVRTYTVEDQPFTMFYEPPSDRGWAVDLVIMIWPYKATEEQIEWILSNNMTGSHGGIKKPPIKEA